MQFSNRRVQVAAVVSHHDNLNAATSAAAAAAAAVRRSRQQRSPGSSKYNSSSGSSRASCHLNGSSSTPQHHQLHPHRHFSWRATRSIDNPTLPPEIAELIAQSRINDAVRPAPPPLEERPMQFESRRAGVIAVKAGMMQDWDEYGARVPLTVLWIDECTVVRHKHQQRDGVTSLVLGCSAKRPKQLHPRQLGEYAAAGVTPKRKLWECKVTEDALLPAGTMIGAAHFKAGQYLDISGVTKGKGFAGVMKRWNFAGQNATHGNTKHHRAPGSIGGRTDPGKVWKGKKMPGHLGCERVTFKNIWVYKVDPARNLLFVRGQVPGPQGSFVYVRDAFRWKWAERQAAQLPFPTFLGEALPEVQVARSDRQDPYRVYREDVGYFEADWKGD